MCALLFLLLSAGGLSHSAILRNNNTGASLTEVTISSTPARAFHPLLPAAGILVSGLPAGWVLLPDDRWGNVSGQCRAETTNRITFNPTSTDITGNANFRIRAIQTERGRSFIIERKIP